MSYIFDFAPNRALSLINEYNSRLNIKDSTNPEKQVAEFINFLPVLCFSEDGMNQLKATELIDMALSGIASTMLAKKWQSPLMVNVTDTMLERLLANPELLKSLEQIEAFRNLNTEITQIISSEKALKVALEIANYYNKALDFEVILVTCGDYKLANVDCFCTLAQTKDILELPDNQTNNSYFAN